MQEH